MKLSLTISAPGSRFAPIMLQGDYLEMIREAHRLGYETVELHIGIRKRLMLTPWPVPSMSWA